MTNWPPAGPPRWGARTMQELLQATEDCLVHRQTDSARERSNTRMLVVECSGTLVPPLYSMLGVMPRSSRFNGARNESLSESLSLRD